LPNTGSLPEHSSGDFPIAAGAFLGASILAGVLLIFWRRDGQAQL
jgi:hypothetical protein